MERGRDREKEERDKERKIHRGKVEEVMVMSVVEGLMGLMVLRVGEREW
jgi:hypothetical protein